jgi:hypothetical protein
VFLAALFGLPLGRTPPKSPLQEAWLVVGPRCGKFLILALVGHELSFRKGTRCARAVEFLRGRELAAMFPRCI